MPRDANGVVADIAVLSKGIVARTNLGKLYEQYLAASSRQTKKRIMDILSVNNLDDFNTLLDTEINVAYNYLLDYLSKFNTTQYKLYSGILDIITIADKKEILKEIMERELYIVYNAKEEETVYDIVNRLEDSKHKLEIVPVYIKDPITNTFKEMKSRAMIAPLYTIMLNKITDSFLGASTFFLNGYGLPTGKSKEDGRFNFKMKMVRGWGESEMRLAAAYGTPRLIQILLDRSKSIINHRKWIKKQLLTGTLTNYTLIDNREEESDVAINIVKAILEPAGVTIHNEGLELMERFKA